MVLPVAFELYGNALGAWNWTVARSSPSAATAASKSATYLCCQVGQMSYDGFWVRLVWPLPSAFIT